MATKRVSKTTSTKKTLTAPTKQANSTKAAPAPTESVQTDTQTAPTTVELLESAPPVLALVPPVESSITTTQSNLMFGGLYNKFELAESDILELESCAHDIEVQRANAIEAMVVIGERLLQAKSILGDKAVIKQSKGRERGTFVLWVEERICRPLNISYDTVGRWMAVTEEVKANPDLKANILSMQPTVLYETIKPSFPDDLKLAVLQAEPQTLTVQQVKEIKKLNSAVRAQELKIAPAAVVAIGKSTATPSNSVIRQVSKLDTQGQLEVAKALVEDPNNALAVLKAETERVTEARQEHRDQAEQNLIDTTISEHLAGVWYQAIKSLPIEEVQLALVECPLDNSWRDSTQGLSFVTKELESCLAPGGFAIIFLGHVSILSAANYMNELRPLHLLTVRRQPGNTPTNIGTNTGFASVHAVLAYKPPFKSPVKVVYDLQTYIANETPLAGLEEVSTGIEAGINKFLDSLVRATDVVAHVVVGERQFNLRTDLFSHLQELNASKVYFVGG